MIHIRPVFAVLLLVACSSSAAAAAEESKPGPSPDVEAPFPQGVDQIVHRAGQIEWGPCPPGPASGPGCSMAVLEGSPTAGHLFTIRIRTTGPLVIPPHLHPRNERVTVIEGAVHVGFGDTLDKTTSQRFESGDYYVNRAGAHHFVWSDEPVVLQITGIGPWEIRPVQASTD